MSGSQNTGQGEQGDGWHSVDTPNDLLDWLEAHNHEDDDENYEDEDEYGGELPH
jgi:hypothetical protein